MVVFNIDSVNHISLCVNDFDAAYASIAAIDTFTAKFSRTNTDYFMEYSGNFELESGLLKTDRFNNVILASITIDDIIDYGEYELEIALNGAVVYNGYCVIHNNTVMTEGTNGIIIGNGI